MREKIRQTIIKYNLIKSGDRIVLAVSGGPDSICMLNILNDLKTEFRFEIIVAHVNHGIRENSVIDEEYVMEFCKNLNLPCFICHANVLEEAKKQKRGLEEMGRIVRYNFFEEIAKEHNANKIAIAHNSNDNVETIVMNIIRGSGMSGLKGIEPKSGKYIRPLIEIKREDIESYTNKFNPRYDESNDDNEFTRNKIRNIVIPYLKNEFNPNFLETITRLSEIATEESKYLEKLTEEAYKNICLEEKNLKDIVYNNENKSTIIVDLKTLNCEEKSAIIVDLRNLNCEEKSAIVLDLRKFNSEDEVIRKRLILYSINKIFGNTKGIEKVHIDDIIKLCSNNIGNKYLMPNKYTKIVIKNKKIFLISV